MIGPRGDTPMDADGDLTALAALDRALDELAAGRDTGAAGEAAALAAFAAELQAAVPAPPAAVAEHGRAAFLARAGVASRAGPSGQGFGGRAALDRVGVAGRWRRWLPVRVMALAAALVLLAAVPAVARQARPGTALWPLRHAGQQVRLALADDPVQRARLRLNTAQSFIAAGAGAGEERREDLADQARDEVRAALEVIGDLAGPRAAAERSRAERLLADLEALEDNPDDRSGPGSGPGSGSGADEDRSGRGGGGPDDRAAGDDDDGSRSGSGSLGPGPGSGWSGSGGSGDD
ncbi:MAG TPA: hypothetical protein VK942_14595 [Actinomycetes bacterium]|nr:hypothetical protein [Actinomycetes bacterium]